MSVQYDPANLEKKNFFSPEEKKLLHKLNGSFSVEKFLSNHRALESLGIDFIHASAQIEGNTYSKSDTAELLLRGQTAGQKMYSDARMILNLRSAFDYVLSYDSDVETSTVSEIHALVTEGELSSMNQGIPRDEVVLISGSEYVPPVGQEYIYSEFEYLMKTYESIVCPFDSAIYLHLNLAYVQVFLDGNKRTARMCQTISMLRDNVIPLLFDERATRSYRDSLITYYESGDPFLYAQWFKEQYINMFQKLNPPQLPIRKK